jgi:hypothetical protein
MELLNNPTKELSDLGALLVSVTNDFYEFAVMEHDNVPMKERFIKIDAFNAKIRNEFFTAWKNAVLETVVFEQKSTVEVFFTDLLLTMAELHTRQKQGLCTICYLAKKKGLKPRRCSH